MISCVPLEHNSHILSCARSKRSNSLDISHHIAAGASISVSCVSGASGARLTCFACPLRVLTKLTVLNNRNDQQKQSVAQQPRSCEWCVQHHVHPSKTANQFVTCPNRVWKCNVQFFLIKIRKSAQTSGLLYLVHDKYRTMMCYCSELECIGITVKLLVWMLEKNENSTPRNKQKHTHIIYDLQLRPNFKRDWAYHREQHTTNVCENIVYSFHLLERLWMCVGLCVCECVSGCVLL